MAKKALKKPAKSRPAGGKLGSLPEWDLGDLYPGIDSPEIKRDLEQADADCLAFEQDFKGKLAQMAAGQGAPLDDKIGRIGSYATLVYSGNSTDPARAKFFGDVQERLTAASLHLLFFTLELNRIDDKALEAAMADPALGHYRPW